MDFQLIFVILILYSCTYAVPAVEQHAIIGKDTELTCRVDVASTSGLVVYWMSPKKRILSQNNVLKTTDTRFSVSMPYNNEYVLKLTRIVPDDAGAYVCQIMTKPMTEKIVTLVIDRPPVISQSTPDINATLGNAVTLSCIAEGPPAPDVMWFRYTYSGDRIDLSVVGRELTIDSVTRADAGVYECVADNAITPPAEKKIRVDVLCAPEMRLPYKRLGQTLGHDTLMTCIVSANPPATVTWSHGDVVLTPSTKYAFNAWEQDTYVRVSGVLVRSIEDADYGEYTCSASNSLGQISLSMTIDNFDESQPIVPAPGLGPRITRKPEDTIGQAEGLLKLACEVADMTSEQSVIWWHAVPNGGSVVKLFDSSESDGYGGPSSSSCHKYCVVDAYNLIISNLNYADAGNYTCELTGVESHSVAVTVTMKASCDVNATQVLEGATVGLQCVLWYSGVHADWDVEWSFKHHAATTEVLDSSYMVNRVLIFQVVPRDTGSYTCTVSNRHVKYSSSCHMSFTVKEDCKAAKDKAEYCWLTWWDESINSIGSSPPSTTPPPYFTTKRPRPTSPQYLATTRRPPLQHTVRPTTGGGATSGRPDPALPSTNALRLMNTIANTLQQMTNIEGEKLKVERQRLEVERERLELARQHCGVNDP